MIHIYYPTNPFLNANVSFTYDIADRLVSMTQGNNTTSWDYNEAYELVGLSTPQGGLEYEYDNLGRLWKLIKNTNQVTEYEYDDASRLVSVLNPYNELTEFEYDDDSKLIRKLFANGTKEEYSYDERNRLLGIVLKKSNNDVLSSHEYVYDAVSNIIARDDNGTVTEFAYDLIDQLLTETKQGYSAEYTYDANGNRLTRTVDSVTETYEYDDADKLLNVKINNTPVKEYTYDDCGRLIEVESSAGTTYLQWDIRNRLTQITYPNSSTNSFGYNGFGARISKSDSTGNYTFFRNGAGVTDLILSDSYASYTPGISERRSNDSTFYHSDLKNYVTQTSSSETVYGANQYDAFGNLIDYSGSWNGSFAYGGPYSYQTDNDSGLMLLGHRYYDSSTGRFLNVDPIGDGSNWYAYCSNNPLKFADRNGLSPEPTFERVVDPWLDDGPATSFSTGRLPSFPWWKFEFDLEVVTNGIKTGAAAIGSAASLGFWDGGSYKDEPGFGFAKGAATVALVALALAGGVAVVPRATLIIADKGIPSTLVGQGVVIGNNMNRVRTAANVFGAAFFKPATTSRVIGWFKNLWWITTSVITKQFILDIGPVPGSKARGLYYIMERVITRLLTK